MTAIATLPVLMQTGNHASRPAASAVGTGALYSCTTHSLVYQTNGSSWSTWATLGTAGALVDPMTTRGDMIVRNASNATARLARGVDGAALRTAGSDLAWTYPPGYEFDYVEITGAVTVSGTSEGGATTVITGTSVSYPGDIVLVHIFIPRLTNGAGGNTIFVLLDGSTVLGRIAMDNAQTITPVSGFLRLTPSAGTHQFILKAWRQVADSSIDVGAGGSGTEVPGFLRVTRV